MIDNILETCMTTVQEGVYHLESPDDVKSTVQVSFVMVLVEKALQKCSDFSTSFIKMVNVSKF
jgi:hypothetical protein